MADERETKPADIRKRPRKVRISLDTEKKIVDALLTPPKTPAVVEKPRAQIIADLVKHIRKAMAQGHTLESVAAAIQSTAPEMGEISISMLKSALKADKEANAKPASSGAKRGRKPGAKASEQQSEIAQKAAANVSEDVAETAPETEAKRPPPATGPRAGTSAGISRKV